MINPYPVVHIGTISAEVIRIVGIIPERGAGLLVRGLDVFTSVEIAPSPGDYWQFDIGTVVGAMSFTSRHSWADPFRGIPVGRFEVPFSPPTAYSVGEVVALRVRPVGSPASLTWLQVGVRLEEA